MVVIYERMLNLTQWGVAFDELHAKNVALYSPTIHSLILGAVQYDSFQVKQENQLIYLYPKEVPNAKIRIDISDAIFNIETNLLWKQIEQWANEEKNAYG